MKIYFKLIKNIIYGIILSGFLVPVYLVVSIIFWYLSSLFFGASTEYDGLLRGVFVILLMSSISVGLGVSFCGFILHLAISFFSPNSYKNLKENRLVFIPLALLFAGITVMRLY